MIKNITHYLIVLLALISFNDITLAQDKQVLAQSYYIKAQENYGEGNSKKAIEYLDQSLGYLDNKTNPRIESLYTQIYSSNKQYIKAEKHIDLYFKKASRTSIDYNKMMSMVVDIKESAKEEKEKLRAIEKKKEQELLTQKKQEEAAAKKLAEQKKRKTELKSEIDKINLLISEENFTKANELLKTIKNEEVFDYYQDINGTQSLDCFNNFNKLKKENNNIQITLDYIENSVCKEAYKNELKKVVSSNLITNADNLFKSENKEDLEKSKGYYSKYIEYTPSGDRLTYSKSKISALENKISAINMKADAQIKKLESENKKVDYIVVTGFTASARNIGFGTGMLRKKMGYTFGFRLGGWGREIVGDVTNDPNYVIDKNKSIKLNNDASFGHSVISSGSQSAVIEDRDGQRTIIKKKAGELNSSSFTFNIGLNYQVSPNFFLYSDLGVGYIKTTQLYTAKDFYSGVSMSDYWIPYKGSFKTSQELGIGFFLSKKYYVNLGMLIYPKRPSCLSAGIYFNME